MDADEQDKRAEFLLLMAKSGQKALRIGTNGRKAKT